MHGQYVDLLENSLKLREEDQKLELATLQEYFLGWVLAKTAEDNTYLENLKEDVLEDFNEDVHWMYGNQVDFDLELPDFEPTMMDVQKKVEAIRKGDDKDVIDEPKPEGEEESGNIDEPIGDTEEAPTDVSVDSSSDEAPAPAEEPEAVEDEEEEDEEVKNEKIVQAARLQ